MADGKCPVTVPEWHKGSLVTLSRNGGFFVVNVFTSVCGQTLVKQTFRSIPSTNQLLAISHSNTSNRNRSLILNSDFYSAHESEVEGTSLFTGACSVHSKNDYAPGNVFRNVVLRPI